MRIVKINSISCNLIILFVFYTFFSHIYYFKYVAFALPEYFSMIYLAVSLLISLTAFFSKNKFVLWPLFFTWSVFCYFFPFISNVSFPIVGLGLLGMAIRSQKEFSNFEQQFFLRLITFYLVAHYVLIAGKKVLNPLWVKGTVISSLFQTELGVHPAIRDVFGQPSLAQVLSIMTIIIEFSAFGLLFKKTRYPTIFLMIIFHLLTVVTFKLYFISIVYILFYFWLAVQYRLLLQEQTLQNE